MRRFYFNLQAADEFMRASLQFGFAFRHPLAKTFLHGLPARPAANVNCRNDLEGPEPLNESLQFQEAAVLTVRDSCNGKEKLFYQYQ